MKKETYNIGGMSCSACSASVQRAAEKLESADKITVNLLTGTMTLCYDENKLTSEDIIKAVEQAGYTARIKNDDTRENRQKKLEKHADFIKLRLIISAVFLIVLMFVSMGHMIGINIIPENMLILKGLVELFLMLPVVTINFRYFISGFRALFKLRPNMDSLIAVGSASSVIYSLWLLLSGGAHHYYFESAAMILTFVTVGKFFESKSKAKTTNAINKLIDLSPKKSLILLDGNETEINSEDISVGDIVVIKSGMVIPVDGTIISGNGNVDESAVTGESIPLYKNTGDKITSGTSLVSGYITFKAERVGKDTTLSGIIRLVEEATTTKPKIAKFADIISGIFVPAVILISLITGILWYITSRDFELALNFAISVLVISCPCALGLATPTAIMVGTGKAAELGILIKSAEIFETADNINAVLFDKTGTITEGTPSVTSIVTEVYNEKEFIILCGKLESKSDHPLAHAIVKYSDIGKVAEIEDYNDIIGKGISGVVDGHTLRIGNSDFVSDCNVSENLKSASEIIASKGETVLYVAESGVIIGIIGIADTIKESAKEAVRVLKASGIETVMITGDNKITAEQIRKETDIDKVSAELLPADKNKIIKEYQHKGRCAMVGDGVNDSPALAAADLGIALGAGTDIAMESADVILMHNDLRDVGKALEICRKVMKNIRQNLFWALFYNALCIPIAAGALYPIFEIKLSPAIGTIAMSLSSICVVSNALRLRKIKKTYPTAKGHKEINNEKENNMKTISIEGMMCPHCEARVKSILAELDANVEVDHTKGIATIASETDNDTIKKVVESAGYKVTDIK